MTKNRPYINFDLWEGRQKRDLQKLLDKAMTDKRFYEALVADSSECFRKYGLDLPKELSELITYGRLREDGHIHSFLIRISSVLASILSQMMSSCTRSALKYEKPLIFSLPISKEIYDETTLNLGGSG